MVQFWLRRGKTPGEKGYGPVLFKRQETSRKKKHGPFLFTSIGQKMLAEKGPGPVLLRGEKAR